MRAATVGEPHSDSPLGGLTLQTDVARPKEANEQRGGPTGVQRPSACQALEAIQDAREGCHRVAGLDEEASPTDPTIAAQSEKAANNTSKVTPWC